MERAYRLVVLCLLLLGTMAAPASATHDSSPDASGMTQLFASPNATGAINSDLAFWGNRAYAGNYDGFRIFDISNPAAPVLLEDFPCHGPQNDPAVWSNGRKTLLFLAVDRTQSKPECGSVDTAHNDPNGWEGVRIFDVSNPTAPKFVKAVYTDCGAHTITLYPKNPGQILLYVSSYPLRPGPTCGDTEHQNRANPYDEDPGSPNSPVHGVIQVIRVPVNAPHAASELTQLPIVYPGDPDNQIVWAEHGLPPPPALEPAARACHDIGVFVELRLAGAACAEQAQLWRIRPNGLPDTQHPIWVYDDEVDETGITGNPNDPGVVVDFWHSATFSWDGKIVNFIDESFGSGCPTVTTAGHHPGDTGRMFFLRTADGQKLSHFMITRPGEPEYCSAHLGNAVHSPDANLLVNAWYTGGADVIDFNNPAAPFEATFWDPGPTAAGNGGDNWSAYWYEGPALPGNTLTMYGTDGVEDPPSGQGFQVFSALTDVTEVPLPFLNPQTQMNVLND
jgi:hypothetical protein